MPAGMHNNPRHLCSEMHRSCILSPTVTSDPLFCPSGWEGLACCKAGMGDSVLKAISTWPKGIVRKESLNCSYERKPTRFCGGKAGKAQQHPTHYAPSRCSSSSSAASYTGEDHTRRSWLAPCWETICLKEAYARATRGGAGLHGCWH